MLVANVRYHNHGNFRTTPHHNGKIPQVDPLVAFTNTFLSPSWRSFVAAPTMVKQSSLTVHNNCGIVSVCDNVGGYSLLHYRDTTELNLKKRMLTEELKPEAFWNIKGMIFNELGELVCRGFPFTPIRVVNDTEFTRTLDSVSQKTLIREWKEGTVVRIWTDNKGAIHVSTTRRIDGHRSKHGDAPEIVELIHHAGLDLGRFKSRSEADTEEEAKDNKIPAGTVFVLLIVHPKNQTQNPNIVVPTAYLLDTWVRNNGPAQGNGRARKTDSIHCMKRLAYDATQLVDGRDGVERLPMLNMEEATLLFKQGRSIYVQKNEFGTVYRSQMLGTRYAIRGDREHLYHRFVELGSDCLQLLDCVPLANKPLVSTYPARYADDIEQFLAYMESLNTPDSVMPSRDSSLYAFFTSTIGVGNNNREKYIQRLLATHPLVLYNMISCVRNKNKSRVHLDSEHSTSPVPERSDSPSN